MTVILAIDTATEYGSVAVGEPGRATAELLIAGRRHAAGLMPAIGEVMRIADVGFQDLSGILVADGPGSFTGLRIGFATAKGIQREHSSVALMSAPSLLCLAYGARHLAAGPVAALYDALRGDVFAAVYRFAANSVVCELAPTIGTIAELRLRCAAKPGIAVGDGALVHRQAAADWSGRDPIGPPDFVPRAASLLGLLTLHGATRVVEDTAAFEPDYGRLAEAQVRLERARQTQAGDERFRE